MSNGHWHDNHWAEWHWHEDHWLRRFIPLGPEIEQFTLVVWPTFETEVEMTETVEATLDIVTVCAETVTHETTETATVLVAINVEKTLAVYPEIAATLER